MDKVEERITELRNVINRIDRIVSGLESSEAFALLLDDFKNQMKRIDSVWQFEGDENKLRELRIVKLATSSIVNILETYKADFTKAKIELAKLENPDVLVNKDYDSQ